MNVYLPKDRVTNAHQGYGFVEFRSEDDADYVSWHADWGRGNRRQQVAIAAAHTHGRVLHIQGAFDCAAGAVARTSSNARLSLCLPVCVSLSAGAPQAIKILNMIKMYGKPIRVNKASTDKKVADVGANLFIGNLDVDVDEKVVNASMRLGRG